MIQAPHIPTRRIFTTRYTPRVCIFLMTNRYKQKASSAREPSKHVMTHTTANTGIKKDFLYSPPRIHRMYSYFELLVLSLGPN